MVAFTIVKQLRAEQWLPGENVPKDVVPCRPEVWWSADRTLIYFTYAKLICRHWLGVEKLNAPPSAKSLEDWIEYTEYTPAESAPKYWRISLPFACCNIKSEARVKRDYRAVFFDPDTEPQLLELWHDYCYAEQWPNPIPKCVEYQIVSGAYGRGYKPLYLEPGDWLVHEDGADDPRVMSNKDFEKLFDGAGRSRHRHCPAKDWIEWELT